MAATLKLTSKKTGETKRLYSVDVKEILSGPNEEGWSIIDGSAKLNGWCTPTPVTEMISAERLNARTNAEEFVAALAKHLPGITGQLAAAAAPEPEKKSKSKF